MPYSRPEMPFLMASKCIVVAMGHGQIMDIGRGYAWSSVRVLVTSSWSSVLNMPQGGGGEISSGMRRN